MRNSTLTHFLTKLDSMELSLSVIGTLYGLEMWLFTSLQGKLVSHMGHQEDMTDPKKSLGEAIALEEGKTE